MPRASTKGARHLRIKCEIYRILEEYPAGLNTNSIHERLTNTKAKKIAGTARQTSQILLRMHGVEKIGVEWTATGKTNIFALEYPEDFIEWLDDKIVHKNSREELRDILEGRKINDP